MVRTGIDQIDRLGALPLPGAGRVALLCNATTISRAWLPTLEALRIAPGVRIERVFSPQHGFSAEKQDNMIESPDERHPHYAIPITSLYAQAREPAATAFNGIDALIIDLQDVGTRVYTFLHSALLTIRAAAARGVPAIVLDRPNPIGGAIDGPVLDPAFASFVGMIAVPLRHGLTPGEYCRYAARELGLADDAVRIVPLSGWRRASCYDETDLPWTTPSPNMPALDTALVYPGQVILEGTNLSEGRGTTRPFECFGAPWLDAAAVLRFLETSGHITRRVDWGPGHCSGRPLPLTVAKSAETSASVGWGVRGSLLAGAVLREIAYEPTFGKYSGERVHGFQIHVCDRAKFRPIAATLAIIWAIRRVHAGAFAWREPPYEYEWRRKPVDLICGTDRVRVALESGTAPEDIVRSWDAALREYADRVAPDLIYGSLQLPEG